MPSEKVILYTVGPKVEEGGLCGLWKEKNHLTSVTP